MSPGCFPHDGLPTGLSLAPQGTNLARPSGQQAPGILWSLIPQSSDYTTPGQPALCVGSGNQIQVFVLRG